MNAKTAAPGFSLVEVALSLAILAVAMVGVLSLLPVGLGAARQVHAEAVAVQVIREVISGIEATNRVSRDFSAYRGAQLYSVEGVATNANGYFSVTVQQSSLSADSCRYFLTLRWPSAAAPDSRTAQQRVFVSDQVRTW